MSMLALRASLIWRDEVMDDLVIEKPVPITVGSVGKPTFIIPDVGLPKNFPIVRPGNRGYLLTLGEKMRGTICIEGKEHDVAEFVAKGAGSAETMGGFRATPISGRDWGVIDLDESGDYKLFFQFVQVDAPVPFFTKPVLYAGLGGYLLSAIVLGAIFYIHGIDVDWLLVGSERLAMVTEGLFRGLLIGAAALASAALLFWVTRQDGDSQASLAFSVLLHAALLFMTYQLYDHADPFVWPGSRSLTGSYLVTRLEAAQPEPPQTATGTAVAQQAAEHTKAPTKNIAKKGAQGKAGGEGKIRATDPNAKPTDKVEAPQVAYNDPRAQQVYHALGKGLDLGKFVALGDTARSGDVGAGHGHGGGLGPGEHGMGSTIGGHGHGPGGGGFSDADVVSHKGHIDAGPLRAGGGNCATPPCGTGARTVHVDMAGASGDFAGLTAEEISKVVRSRAGVFRACYQRELNRAPSLAGKLDVHFVIGGNGLVKSAKASGSLRDASVQACVERTFMSLHFPAKGGIANVNWPLVFQSGG